SRTSPSTCRASAAGASTNGYPDSKNTRGRRDSTPRPLASARHAGRTVMLVGEDAAQLLHDLLFGVRLGDRKFLDEQVARRIEHLPFSERELLVPLQHEEVTQHLGDFEHAAGLDLLCVLPVAAVPGLLVDLHLLVAQDPVDLGNHVLADDPPQADGLDVLRRDHDGHVAVDDAEHVELALTARDDLGLHPLNDAYAMSRIHN